MWFKQTGNEVGAPPERRGELLPENFAEYRRRFSAEAAFDYQAMTENVILFGTPVQVAEKVDLLKQSGVEKLILFVNFGGIDHQKVLDSLELFSREVIPSFSD
jgi:alkanesulfonate monooxygenase SsuD/methylene tetrahydromethanopterin reductase-like flavin-dependent oxidoreductase (luciferase family)